MRGAVLLKKAGPSGILIGFIERYIYVFIIHYL